MNIYGSSVLGPRANRHFEPGVKKIFKQCGLLKWTTTSAAKGRLTDLIKI